MDTEKYTSEDFNSTVVIVEGKIESFNKSNSITNSFRVHKDGLLGVHFHNGKLSDEEGFKQAEENLELKRPYPFELESGTERSRDKTEKIISDVELMNLAKKGMARLRKQYPDFNFSGKFYQSVDIQGYENTKGAKYLSKDGHIGANLDFKHKDSKDIIDGFVNYNDRKFSLRKFYKNVDNVLKNFTKPVEMPEELIIQMPYYDFIGYLRGLLDVEQLALGTSLLSGKIGQKIFADDFTVFHCVDDKNCWHSTFWDGEGVVLKKDKLVYIQNGVVKRGYADKRIAAKYKAKATGSAGFNYSDIPRNGFVNFIVKRSTKKTKELLDGRLTVLPLMYSGGGFNEKGDYKMPVQTALLCDGENILGRLPPFTMCSNIFDIFGKDFIGVGKDNPIFNDKTLLVKMRSE